MLPKQYKFRDLHEFKVGDEASLAKEKRINSGKAKARYVCKPQEPNQSYGAPASGGRRALTPGGPQGS